MNKLILTFISCFLMLLYGALLKAETVKITLGDVSQRVKTENYVVLENALRVYQAKESIQVARGNLLPKLNFWRVVAIPFEPMAAVGAIEDIAPFLVPQNWFSLSEKKILYLATEEGYRALWANELMTAKTLYLHIQQDQSLLDHIQENIKLFEEILVIATTYEIMGGMKQGAARDIEVRILSLQEDKRALQVLIQEELNQLSYLMGYPITIELELSSVTFPSFDDFEPIEYSDFEFRALDSSPEVRQYEHFIETAALVKKGVWFSFLGSSSMSQGAAGGVFDMLPPQQGLGFGTLPSQRIVKAQKETLKIQKRGIEETIKRQLKNLVNNYNLDLENYENLKRRSDLTQLTLHQLFERLKLGENVDVLELAEASRNYIQANSSFLSTLYRFLINEDKLSRLIFHGDYDKKPAVIEKLKKQ